MPKGKYPRKRTMQTAPAGVAPAAPEAPSATEFQTAVMAALEGISSQVSGLATRVDVIEQSGPRFVKADVEHYDAALDRADLIDKAPGDHIPRSTTLPVFTSGEAVPDFVLRQYRPLFGTGSRVRLNPDAVPKGRDDGKTRRELMADAGVRNGIGEVFSRMYLSDEGAWKYRCRFPKSVMPGAVNGIVGLYEQELIPS